MTIPVIRGDVGIAGGGDLEGAPGEVLWLEVAFVRFEGEALRVGSEEGMLADVVLFVEVLEFVGGGLLVEGNLTTDEEYIPLSQTLWRLL